VQRCRSLAATGIIIALLSSVGCTAARPEYPKTSRQSEIAPSARMLDPISAAERSGLSIVPTSAPARVTKSQAIQAVRSALPSESPSIVATLVVCSPPVGEPPQVCWLVLAYPVRVPRHSEVGRPVNADGKPVSVERATPRPKTTEPNGQYLLLLNATTGRQLMMNIMGRE